MQDGTPSVRVQRKDVKKATTEGVGNWARVAAELALLDCDVVRTLLSRGFDFRCSLQQPIPKPPQPIPSNFVISKQARNLLSLPRKSMLDV